jgi:hypothetical protein
MRYNQYIRRYSKPASVTQGPIASTLLWTV